MVKGAARSSSSSQQPPNPQPLPNMQAGQNPHDPLTQLNSHMGYGAMAGLNPFATMGLNPNDPNMVCRAATFRTLRWLTIFSRSYLDAINDELTAISAADV